MVVLLEIPFIMMITTGIIVGFSTGQIWIGFLIIYSATSFYVPLQNLVYAHFYETVKPVEQFIEGEQNN